MPPAAGDAGKSKRKISPLRQQQIKPHLLLRYGQHRHPRWRHLRSAPPTGTHHPINGLEKSEPQKTARSFCYIPIFRSTVRLIVYYFFHSLSFLSHKVARKLFACYISSIKIIYFLEFDSCFKECVNDNDLIFSVFTRDIFKNSICKSSANMTSNCCRF